MFRSFPKWLRVCVHKFYVFEIWFKKSKLNQFIKRNKRWLVFAPAFIVSLQLYVMTEKRDKWRTKAELEGIKVVVLQNEIGRTTAIMDDFDWPWYRKTKKGDSIRISGMNQAYEDFFGLDKITSLGKTNFALVPKDIAEVFERMDSTVFATGKPQDGIEPWLFPDSSKLVLYTHKWPSRIYDDVMYGVSVPLRRFVRIIDNKGNMEVIEIVQDTVKNAVQDTLIKNN